MERQHNHSVSMKCNFLIEEYRTLRKEIEETKSRIFKLAILSAAGMPTSYFFAHKNIIDIFTMFLPLLICAVMALYLSESRDLMRCGKYIKENIEPFQEELKKNVEGKDVCWKGWERWLEEDDSPNAFFMKNTKRSVDNFVTFFFYIFFLVHYIASVFLSIEAFRKRFSDAGYYCSVTIWLLLGAFCLVYLILIIGKSTRTK